MFNIGDEVTTKDPELAIGKGVICHISTKLNNIEHTQFVTAHFANDLHLRLPSDAFVLVTLQPQPLTLEQLRIRKEQLRGDVLELLINFEKETQTHVTTIYLDHATYSGSDKEIAVTTGIRIEIKL